MLILDVKQHRALRQVRDRFADAAGAVAEADGFVGTGALQAMHDGNGVHLADCCFQSRVEFDEATEFALQQAGDALQVVLDAVMHFAHQRVALLPHQSKACLGTPDLGDVGMRDDHAIVRILPQRHHHHDEPALLVRRMAGIFKAEDGPAAFQNGLDAIARFQCVIGRETVACFARGEVVGADFGMCRRLAGFDAIFQRKASPGIIDLANCPVAIHHGDRGGHGIQDRGLFMERGLKLVARRQDLRLGLLALADVAQEHEKPAALGRKVDGIDFDIPKRAVLASMHGLELVAAGFDNALNVAGGDLGALLRFQVGNGHAKQLFARVSGLLGVTVIDVDQLALRVDIPEAVEAGRQNVVEVIPARAQACFRLLALRDFLGEEQCRKAVHQCRVEQQHGDKDDLMDRVGCKQVVPRCIEWHQADPGQQDQSVAHEDHCHGTAWHALPRVAGCQQASRRHDRQQADGKELDRHANGGAALHEGEIRQGAQDCQPQGSYGRPGRRLAAGQAVDPDQEAGVAGRDAGIGERDGDERRNPLAQRDTHVAGGHQQGAQCPDWQRTLIRMAAPEEHHRQRRRHRDEGGQQHDGAQVDGFGHGPDSRFVTTGAVSRRRVSMKFAASVS